MQGRAEQVLVRLSLPRWLRYHGHSKKQDQRKLKLKGKGEKEKPNGETRKGWKKVQSHPSRYWWTRSRVEQRGRAGGLCPLRTLTPSRSPSTRKDVSPASVLADNGHRCRHENGHICYVHGIYLFQRNVECVLWIVNGVWFIHMFFSYQHSRTLEVAANGLSFPLRSSLRPETPMVIPGALLLPSVTTTMLVVDA